MKHFLPTRLIPCALLCSLSAPAAALVGGGLDSQIAPITRQIEQKASQAAERAREGRIEQKVEKQQIEAQTAGLRAPLEELPATLSVLTDTGQKAFNDVLLDDGARAVERQWLVTGTESEIAALIQPGITVLERNHLPGLGMTLARFQVTADLDSRKALEAALPELADRLDRNHIYAPQTGADAIGTGAGIPQWQSLCRTPVSIGMVDTAIDTTHPVFGDATIVQQRFLGLEETPGSLTEVLTHGTAVASLMVGQRKGSWPARLPDATLYNASVFYGRDTSLSGATLGHLLEGLNWLAGQELSAINISLTGPDNRLLNTAVRALSQKGILLVAAVGNQGPAAAPLYPAAYPEVVGVTAVDASGGLYRWANRGEQVMFAAPGVSVPVAHPQSDMVTDSGTSLAAPVIAAALACHRVGLSEQQALDALISNARDLGKPGRDTSFGHGFLDL